MLKELLRGREKSKIVLIEDNIGQPAIALVKAWILSLAERYELIHLVLYETPEAQFLKGLPQHCLSKIEVHDIACDPLGWHNKSSLTLDTDLCQRVATPGRSAGTSAVVIDSLSSLILHRLPAYTCQVLHRLAHLGKNGAIEQIVAGIHGDLHDHHALQLLHHSATTIIQVAPPVSPSYTATGNILLKKVSGKVTKLKEQFSLGPDFELEETEEIHSIMDVVGPSSDNPDPAANLTFNLTLSEKEKEDRRQLTLPYIKVKPREEVKQSSGKIFYQPDETDDFDEEDPDDDLDI